MSDDTNVSIEDQDTSQEPELDLELDNQDDTEETKAEVSEDVEALKAKLAEVEAKNKQLYARLKKPAEAKKPSNSSSDGDLEWKKKVDFILTKGKELDAESIDEVVAYAKGKGISYDQALESPVIKSYLADSRSKRRVAQATPPTSAGSVKVGNKTWAEMNDQERAANFDKLREQQRKRM